METMNPVLQGQSDEKKGTVCEPVVVDFRERFYSVERTYTNVGSVPYFFLWKLVW